MKYILRNLFAVLAFGVVGVACGAAPGVAFLRANRPCTIGAYDLTEEVEANNGETWYGATRIYPNSTATLTAALDGYTTAWYSYAQDLTTSREDGPSQATLLIGSGQKLTISSITETLHVSALGYGLFYAVFTPIRYTIQFDLNGATGSRPSVAVKYDQEITPVAPVREGYVFGGWSANGKVFAPNAPISNLTTTDGETVTLTAVWTAETYYLQLGVDKSIAKICYKVGADVWQETTSSKSVSVEYGQKWQAYLEPAYGYSYSGVGGSKSSPMTDTMTSDGAEFPVLQPVKRTYRVSVTAKPAEGCANLIGSGDNVCTYLDELTLQASAQKGWKFVGWSDSTTENPYKLEVIQDKDIVALFEEESASPGTCKITFHAEDGSEKTAEQELTKGVDASLKANSFTRTGYTFTGWSDTDGKTYDDQQCVNFSQDKNLNAVWSNNTYEVIFDANGGSDSMSAQKLTYDKEYTFANGFTPPTDCVFAGWGTNATEAITDSAGKIKNLTALAGDHVQLYAIWKISEIGSLSQALNCLNLKFYVLDDPGNNWKSNSDDGGLRYDYFKEGRIAAKTSCAGVLTFEWKKSENGSISVYHGERMVIEGTSCWSNIVQEVAADTVVSFAGKGNSGAYLRNVRWERKIDGKTVTFKLNGGTRIGGGETTQTVESGHAALSPTVQAPAGYEFDGWDKAIDNVTEDTEVIAQYKKTASRIVYVNTQGATNPNPTTYTVDTDLTFTALDAAKFNGWSPEGIAAGSSGTLVVTAQWEGGATSAVYTVTKANGINDGTVSVVAGNTVMAKAAKTKTAGGLSYVCTGWTGTGDIASGTVSSATPVDGSGNYVVEQKINGNSSITWTYVDVPQDPTDPEDPVDPVGPVDPVDPQDPTEPVVTVVTNLTVGAWAFADDVTEISATIRQGVYAQWAVSAREGTVSVSGLPSGLKYTAKAKKDTVTGLTIPAGSVYGSPSTAKTATSKFTVTTTVGRKKTKTIYKLTLTVTPLPTEIIGKYVGGTLGESAGSVELTVAKTGKVTGKWKSEGATWTLKATGFDGVVGGTGAYRATMSAKSGRVSETLQVLFDTADVASGATHAAGTVGVAVCDLFDATYVNWKAAPWKTLATALKKAKFGVTDGKATLSGTVGTYGTVSVKGSFDVGASKPYAATAKGTLVPLGGDAFELFLYYPPKKNKFDGWAVRLVLTWDGSSLEVVE